MSKFCPSCGSSMPDDSTFCANCGAPVNNNAPAATAPAAPAATNTAAPAAKFGKNTIIAIGAIAVAVILIIVILATVLGGNYKKPVKEYFKAQEMSANSMYSSQISTYGKNIKVKYKITDKDKVSKDDIKDLEKSLKSYKGKKPNIDKAYELDCEVTIKGKKDKDSSDMTITVAKIDGKWYIVDLDD